MKNVQQIKTIFPIGRRDDKSVCTTSFKPGALLITLKGRKDLNSLKTLSIPNIFDPDSVKSCISRSTIDMITKEPSMIFQPDVKYASGP